MLTGEVSQTDARDMGLITHVTEDVSATVDGLIDGILAERHEPLLRQKQCSDGANA